MDKLTSLRAERCRRQVRREKFTHVNCTLPTIHLGPASQGLVMMMMMMEKLTMKQLSDMFGISVLLYPGSGHWK